MAKAVKKSAAGKPATAKKYAVKAVVPKGRKQAARLNAPSALSGDVLDRLWTVVMDRRSADPAHSHSARLLGGGKTKVAQKFGEEAVECLIEAVTGNNPALICESADVLYHLLVMWVAAGIEPADVWSELVRREGVSGVVEKASRLRSPVLAGTTKLP